MGEIVVKVERSIQRALWCSQWVCWSPLSVLVEIELQ